MSRRRRQKQQEQTRNMIIIVAAVLLTVLFGGRIFRNDNVNSGDCGNLYDAREEVAGQKGWCTTKYGYDKVAIVVGNTQNSPVPKIDNKSKEIIADAFFMADPNSDVLDLAIVSASGDGSSMIDLGGDVQAPARNMTATKGTLARNFDIIEEKMKTSPSGDGVDYFNAIQKAASVIRGGTKPAIIVVGSGYSDGGKLNFASDKLLEKYSDARKVGKASEYISSLFAQDSRYFGNELEKIDVHWVNLGQVVSPQAPLDDYKMIQENIYRDAFNYLGVNKFEVGAGELLPGSVDTDRTVKTITPEKVEIKGKTFNIDEKVGKFHADRATLVDERSVKDYLKNNIVNNYKGEEFAITGYVAICGDGSLSSDRANTIRNLLVSLGISKDKIKTDGKPGAPITDPSKESDKGGYTCDSILPETDRRTVKIEVR